MLGRRLDAGQAVRCRAGGPTIVWATMGEFAMKVRLGCSGGRWAGGPNHCVPPSTI
jgi:hypothetical protein